jgi:hypothetical protein
MCTSGILQSLPTRTKLRGLKLCALQSSHVRLLRTAELAIRPERSSMFFTAPRLLYALQELAKQLRALYCLCSPFIHRDPPIRLGIQRTLKEQLQLLDGFEILVLLLMLAKLFGCRFVWTRVGKAKFSPSL